MVKAKAAEIHFYKVYLKEFSSHNKLQENYDVVVCDKKLAEQIFEEKLNDKYETNVRCSHCGSTEFDAVYDKFSDDEEDTEVSLSTGYFISEGDFIQFNEVEEHEIENIQSYHLKHYICSNCSCAEIDDIGVDFFI